MPVLAKAVLEQPAMRGPEAPGEMPAIGAARVVEERTQETQVRAEARTQVALAVSRAQDQEDKRGPVDKRVAPAAGGRQDKPAKRVQAAAPLSTVRCRCHFASNGSMSKAGPRP